MTYKTPKTIFLFSLIACTALRIYLKLTTIDPATGFYEGNAIVVTAFYLLLIVSVAALFFLRIFVKTPISVSFPKCIKLPAVLTGAAALVACASPLLTRLSALSLPTGSLPGILVGLVSLLLTFAIFIAAPVITGGLFLWLGARAGAPVGPQDDARPALPLRCNGIMALAPLFWQTGVLLTSFMAYTAVRSVSDQMLALVSLIFFVPFLLAHARVLAGVDPVKGARQLVAFGLPFSLLAISTSCGALAAAATGQSLTVSLSLAQSVFYLFAGIYAALLCFCAKE